MVWAELFRQLNLRGDERILDLGCGRGAVLLLAAQHLTTGRAVGVDLWRKDDQSGNAAEATRRNAIAEGVADRVEIHTADMTALPFANGSFDLVVSNVAVHNVKGQPGRAKVIEEAVRVLRPGGRLLIADILGTGQYLNHLTRLGMLGAWPQEPGMAAVVERTLARHAAGHRNQTVLTATAARPGPAPVRAVAG